MFETGREGRYGETFRDARHLPLIWNRERPTRHYRSGAWGRQILGLHVKPVSQLLIRQRRGIEGRRLLLGAFAFGGGGRQRQRAAKDQCGGQGNMMEFRHGSISVSPMPNQFLMSLGVPRRPAARNVPNLSIA
jgi:hypothetical protein